jgi:hypothetical protein
MTGTVARSTIALIADGHSAALAHTAFAADQLDHPATWC